jgi:hypothetical protein
MCTCLSGFLELINNMLITGMVPTLFSEYEKEQVCESIRNASKGAGFGVTRFVRFELLSTDDCFMMEPVWHRLLHCLIILPFCLKRNLNFLWYKEESIPDPWPCQCVFNFTDTFCSVVDFARFGLITAWFRHFVLFLILPISLLFHIQISALFVKISNILHSASSIFSWTVRIQDDIFNILIKHACFSDPIM